MIAYDPLKRKEVKAGELENGVFWKKIKSSKHIQKNMGNSVGIQESVIESLKGKCRYVVLEVDGNEWLLSNFNSWLNPNIKTRDWGHGLQRFFPITSCESFSNKHKLMERLDASNIE